MVVVCIPFLTVLLIINSRIATTHQINITVVVGISFTTVIGTLMKHSNETSSKHSSSEPPGLVGVSVYMGYTSQYW